MLSKDFHPPLLLCPVMLRDMAMEEANSELPSPKAGQVQPNRKRFSSQLAD